MDLVSSLDMLRDYSDEMTRAEIEAATKVGSLAKGLVSIRTHAYDLGAYDPTTLTVRLETDEYLKATDLGGIDETFN